MSKGADLIATERQRQIDEEGFTPQHDAQHDDYSLINAASCYLHASENDHVKRYWPRSWSWNWWKPTTRIKNLIKAGALIAAELDRLIDNGDLTPEEEDLYQAMNDLRPEES